MASLSSAESTSLGDTFQSGARFIKWPDGANHERLSSLLRADGDPIGDGTAEDLGHSIVVFRRIEVQPGVLGILLQQILTLKAATYTLTDQLNQVLKLTFIRGFDALE
jgi:hypothetical protein